MIFLLAGALSLLAGLSLGMLGGGGSILTVPILVYILRVEPRSAIACSLLVVSATSAAGVFLHARAGRVRWKEGMTFALAGTVGALLGSQLGHYFPPSVLLIGFAMIVVATALAMMRARNEATTSAGRISPGRRRWRIVRDGLGVGALTGLVGAGGGFLVVPALALWGGIPMAEAVGTSLLVIAINSAAGFLGTRIHGVGVDWKVAAAMSLTAVVGSLLGVRLGRDVAPQNMRRGFGVFITVLGLFILGGELKDLLPPGWAISSMMVATGVAGFLAARALRTEAPAPPLSPEATPVSGDRTVPPGG